MGRHRHAVTVRVDGLAAVLGSLLDDPRVVAAALVDVDSGMVLDACTPARGGVDGGGADEGGGTDLELLGAGHAELTRIALVMPGRSGAAPADDEVVVSTGAARHHLLRVVPDPHGDRLVLSIVVEGSRRFADRMRKRLRSVAVDALTAGPTVVRRPGTGNWSSAARTAAPLGAGLGVEPAPVRPLRLAGGLFDPSPRPGDRAMAGVPTPQAGWSPPLPPAHLRPARLPPSRLPPPRVPPAHLPPAHLLPLVTPPMPPARAEPTPIGPTPVGVVDPTAADHRGAPRPAPGRRDRPGSQDRDGGPRPPAPPSALPPGRPGQDASGRH